MKMENSAVLVGRGTFTPDDGNPELEFDAKKVMGPDYVQKGTMGNDMAVYQHYKLYKHYKHGLTAADFEISSSVEGMQSTIYWSTQWRHNEFIAMLTKGNIVEDGETPIQKFKTTVYENYLRSSQVFDCETLRVNREASSTKDQKNTKAAMKADKKYLDKLKHFAEATASAAKDKARADKAEEALEALASQKDSSKKKKAPVKLQAAFNKASQKHRKADKTLTTALLALETAAAA